MLSDLLLLSNEWWKNKKISKEKAQEYHREIFEDIKKLANSKQIIILTGMRRVGKTTVLFQLINELIDKIDYKKILYFNFDEKSIEPIDILNEYESITGVDWKKEKCYVFFDEIQKVKDWSSKIKFLYDNKPNLKIFLSGSASLMIRKQAVHNLAGRHFLREMEVLSLKEFAEIYYGKEINNFKLYKNELEKIFPLFLTRPFPELAKEKDKLKINEYIKELVIDKVVKIDIPEIFDVNVQLLKNLTEIFLSNPGAIINITELSQKLKIHKTTLQNHIFYLEFAKIIKIYNNFRPSLMAESRKMKKIYPYNISLSFPFYPDLEKGKITESLIAPFFKNYWRDKEKEIDFLNREKGKLIPVEVKSKKDISKQDLKTLLYFLKKYNSKFGNVLYNGKSESKQINDCKINLINIIEFLFFGKRLLK